MAFCLLLFALALLAAAPLDAQGRIPPECYLDQLENQINSCKYCHTSGQPGAGNDDIDRQGAFPAQENLFLNALDPQRLDALVPSTSIPSDLREFLDFDNYRLALVARGDSPGTGTGLGHYKYFPDLDPEKTGADGFANNGWRAFKWKPYERAWPRYNGRIQQNWIRLPDIFQRGIDGQLDTAVYSQNLDLLVAALRGAPSRDYYLGLASTEPLEPYLFPVGSEILHYLYYLDPAQPDMKARRIKEVRWNIKTASRADEQFDTFGYISRRERQVSLTYREGGPELAAQYGLIYNQDGWDIAAFIEDVDGQLRPQTARELTQCIGCHSRRIGVPIDSHWQSLQRKLPGAEGWKLQDYAGIEDYYNALLARGEYGEIFHNYFGDASALPRNADGSIAFLPSPARAAALNRRYYQIVQSQSFELGRDPQLDNPGFLRAPPTARFRPQDQQQAWQPALDFAHFDVVAPTAVLAEAHSHLLPLQDYLATNYPNPFNAATVLRFALERDGQVQLFVRASDGHHVRDLRAGWLSAGRYEIAWDGRDEAGRPAASGIYFAVLQSATSSRQATKMLLLR